jgi:uncharacterized protein
MAAREQAMAAAQSTEVNPVALGFAGAALPSILLGLINLGVLPQSGQNVVVPLALVLGGTTQFIAGLMEAKAKNTFGLTAFVTFGAFWWWYAALFLLGLTGVLPLKGTESTVAATLLLWGVFTFFLWMATFRLPKIVFLVFLALWLTFGLLGAAMLKSMPQLAIYGGWCGVASGVLMMYGSVAMVLKGAYGRTILPL